MSAPVSAPLLSIVDLRAWYGESQALHGMSLEVHTGEIVCLLGRNGAGKSTTLNAVMGLLAARKGSVRLGGAETIGLPSHRIARLGVALCPEDRGIFADLSVAENLALPPRLRAGGLTDDEVDALFPRLMERRASPGTKLSGGEQQMLAIARILRTGARLLLLDEPTEGLAPVIVQQIGALLKDLRQRGFTILMVEQNFQFAMSVADRHYVVESGRVIDAMSNAALLADTGRVKRHLGV